MGIINKDKKIFTYTIPNNEKIAYVIIPVGTKPNNATIVKNIDPPTEYIPYFEPFFQLSSEIKIPELVNIKKEIENNTNKISKLEETTMNSIKEEISISNSSKIGFYSNSFLNGYVLKGKHPLNYLGNWSDYIMYNYGHSGDDLLELLARLEKNEKWLGDVPVNNWNATYGVIAMQDNDGALFSADKDTYYENGKKLAYALMSNGTIPILGTEHDITTNYYCFNRLANDMGLMFMNWGRRASKSGWYAPFTHNSHPSTRTHWMWTYGMKEYLDTLPRPRKGIKLFRKRKDIIYNNINELVYNDNIERAKLFEEIGCGASVLTKDTEKYFDRLDGDNDKWTNVKDEYQFLQAKTQSVNFNNLMLCEVITPYTAQNISELKIKIDAKGIEHAYIKKNNELSNPLPSNRVIAFGIVEGQELLSPGMTFNITGGVFSDTLIGNYTIDKVFNDMIITKTNSSGKVSSGTDNPICSIKGVSLKGSYDYPAGDYITRFKKPLAEFEEINIENNIITFLNLNNYMDFDKISLVFIGTSDIILTDICATVTGYGEKNNFTKSPIKRVKGQELLTNTLFNQNEGWEGYAETEEINKITNDNYTESFPSGISTVREIKEGKSISQKFSDASFATDFLTPKIQIRLLLRYFPKYISTDEDWSTSEIYEGSYDCATASIKIDDCKIGQIEVGAWWNEFVINTDWFYGSTNSNRILKITAENKNIQIARVECQLI